MIVDWLPRRVLRFIVRLYQQDWFHWFVSIVGGFWDTLFGVVYRSQDRLFHISLWKDWQNRPSPHYPIPMTRNDLPVKPERSDVAGQYIATMIVTYADAAELQALLPPDADLDPMHIHDGRHAIIYMLGYTENLHRVWNPLPGFDYMEFAVGIPSIRIKREHGYSSPFFYLPTLYLNRFYPVVIGQIVGYRKHWGWVYGRDKTYRIAKLGGKKILSAQFEIDTSMPPLIGGGPKVAHWRELMDQPHANSFGPDEFLFLHYHWDWDDALLQPVTANVEVFEKLPGLCLGKHKFEPVSDGDWDNGKAPMGAFRLCAPFELMPPFDRKALDDYAQMLTLEPSLKSPPAAGGGAPPGPSPSS